MMQDEIRDAAKGVLDKYLSENNSRKTPERFAVLDAVYSDTCCFTLDELATRLVAQGFHVSRATLYNTMNLLMQLRLVIRHRFTNGTQYEPCYMQGSNCHKICTMCGKVTEIDIPEVSAVMDNVKLRRFRKDCFSMYVYGVCSSCQSRMGKSCVKSKK